VKDNKKRAVKQEKKHSWDIFKITMAVGFVVFILFAVKMILGGQSSSISTLNSGYQDINMNVTVSGWQPNYFVLKRGIPVRWNINGIQITGCNGGIVVPAYGLNFKIKQGMQIINFTPTETGVVPWSCWMNMINGKFLIN
jgi:plastocyanin domain-containing protein